MPATRSVYLDCIQHSHNHASLDIPPKVPYVEPKKLSGLEFREETRLLFHPFKLSGPSGDGFGFAMNFFNSNQPIGEEDCEKILGSADANEPIRIEQLDPAEVCLTHKQLVKLSQGESITWSEQHDTGQISLPGFVQLHVLKNLCSNHDIRISGDSNFGRSIRLEFHRYGEIKHGFDFELDELEESVLDRFLLL